MRQARRRWTMPDEDARSMLKMIGERIRASDIQVEHRDALIRLRATIEDDLTASAEDGSHTPDGAEAGAEQRG